MLVLTLDTATPTVVVGVIELELPAESGRLTTRAVESVPSQNRHAETLGTMIPAVLRDGALAVSDLGAVVVGLGPGPFTGLRVGIVTAAALGDALGVPVYGVCTHDAIALGYATTDGAAPASRTASDQGFTVVTDARRRECYWADYDASGTRISGPHVQRPIEMSASPDWLAGRLVIGDPAFAEALQVEIRPAQPEPSGLVLAAHGLSEGVPPVPLEPLYLRRPDATPPAARKRVTRT